MQPTLLKHGRHNGDLESMAFFHFSFKMFSVSHTLRVRYEFGLSIFQLFTALKPDAALYKYDF